jgi:Spy/CpxP family protein refolding chaperone
MKPSVLGGYWILVLLAIAVSAIPGTASQSTSPQKWWNSEPYVHELGLSPDQSRRLEDIFQQAAPNERALKKALDEAEAQLERLMAKPDDKAALEQIERVVTARANLIRSHSLMLFRMRRVLTAEQWTRLGTLKAADEHERQKASQKGK